MRFLLIFLSVWTLGAEVDFARQVHPLLLERCGNCHSGQNRLGSLSLDSRESMLKGGASGAAIVPGKSGESLLLARVNGTKAPRMPMGAPPLSTGEIGLLKQWIDEGAPGAKGPLQTKWTSPLAPRRVTPPAGEGNPIDRLLKVNGQVVSDAVFARRVYYDIWGLPPTPSQLGLFLHDRKIDKRERLIDMLLRDNRRYADHWITFWNDLLRNDEGVVYHGDRKSITQWLEKALESNLPYNRFTVKLLNPVEKDDPEGFLTGITWRGEVPAAERPPMQAAQNSAQVFLGINLKCNSCHDSFISQWKLKDAYGLASFFSEQPLELVRCDVKTGEMAKVKFLFPELGDVPEGLPLAERRAMAAEMFTKPENGRFTRTYVNRIWKQLYGRGIVEQVDDMAAEPFHPDLLDWLAVEFAEHGYDSKYLLRLILTSKAYQLPAVASKGEPGAKYVFRGPEYRRLSAEQFADTISAITGEWRIKEGVKRGTGLYAREWQMKSSSLTRAMGRPIRDQVMTDRLTQPTTLQALELVNGATLAAQLHRGAQRLLGELPPAPAPLYDSGVIRQRPATVDVDITGAQKLYLLISDVGSYDPLRTVAGWVDAEVVSESGTTPLAAVAGMSTVQMALDDKGAAGSAMTQAIPWRLVVDLKGKPYTRLRARVGVSVASWLSEIGPAVRFFVYAQPPDEKQLLPPVNEPAIAFAPAPKSAEATISFLYAYALGRAPSAEEQRVGKELLGRGTAADGLEDLLWAIFLSPEFQYLR